MHLCAANGLVNRIIGDSGDANEDDDGYGMNRERWMAEGGRGREGVRKERERDHGRELEPSRKAFL